jgi:glycosyltransferase involved in cell wall biosynthesis
MKMKLISVVTPCYNEEENIADVYGQVREVFSRLDEYRYEHIFIDNASQDHTVEILKGIARIDPNVKIIVNTRNFGHIRSPYYGLLQSKGEAVIMICADLQDPPSLIPEFIKKWEKGYRMVLGVKTQSEEPFLMFAVRRFYYHLIGRLADIELIKNYTGFGLYDQKVIQTLREINDPYPYFRGLICDLGFESTTIEYVQKRRKRGLTKNNFYILYDIAMLGITNHTKIPLRLATMLGFMMSGVSLCIGIGYLIAKLIFWNRFEAGIAPVLVGIYFLASVVLFFIGILGEYIGAIHTQVLKRPLVIEKERINFEP